MRRVDLYERLLEHGRLWVEPAGDAQAVLGELEGAGLVQAASGTAFRCFDPAEEACHDHPSRACSAWVAATTGPAVCRTCGLGHEWPENRTQREMVEVRRLQAGVEAWLEAAVARLDPGARRLRSGLAWQLVVGDADAEVVWLDERTPERLTSRAYAVGRPVVFVVAEPRRWRGRFNQEPWLEPLSLAAWFVQGPAAVRRAFGARRTERDGMQRSWAAERPTEPRALNVPLGAHLLEVGNDGATLDGHEVVGRDGVAVLALLRVLVERWREDLADDKAAADHCSWTVDELREALIEAGTTPSRGTVQRQLQRVRAGIRVRYQRATGVRLEDNAVVEHVSGDGYRINPSGVLARMK